MTREALIEAMAQAHLDTYEGGALWDRLAEWERNGGNGEEEFFSVREILADERKCQAAVLTVAFAEFDRRVRESAQRNRLRYHVGEAVPMDSLIRLLDEMRAEYEGEQRP